MALQGFAFISGDFAFEKGTKRTITTEDPAGAATALTGEVEVMTIGAIHGYAFFGVNGPYFDSNNDGKVDANDSTANSDAMGLAISNVTFGIALMRPTATAGNPLSPMKSFFALKASGNVALVGIDGFDASILNATVEINQGTPAVAGGVARAVNFKLITPDSELPIRAGPAATDIVHLDFAGTVFRASGFVTLNIGEFVHFEGNLAFEKGETYTGRVIGATTDQTFTVLKIGASNVNLFAGVNGQGLQLSQVDFGIALFKPTTPGSRSSYFALKATAKSVALVGIPDVTIAATDLTVEINSASVPASRPPRR